MLRLQSVSFLEHCVGRGTRPALGAVHFVATVHGATANPEQTCLIQLPLTSLLGPVVSHNRQDNIYTNHGFFHTTAFHYHS